MNTDMYVIFYDILSLQLQPSPFRRTINLKANSMAKPPPMEKPKRTSLFTGDVLKDT